MSDVPTLVEENAALKDAVAHFTATIAAELKRSAAYAESYRKAEAELAAARAEVEAWISRDMGIRDSIGALPFETIGEAIERLKQGREKAEAELSDTLAELDHAVKRFKDTRAELDAARPLIEAAMGYKPEPFGHGRERLHEAAQDYQQKTSEKGEKP